MRFLTSFLLATSSIASALSLGGRRDACSSLTSGYGAKYTVVNATLVQAGNLELDGLDGTNNLTFCRVFSQMPYGSNSTLNFEVWLPEGSSYNDRYLSVGNGGFAGIIDYYSMLSNLNTGFAVGGYVSPASLHSYPTNKVQQLRLWPSSIRKWALETRRLRPVPQLP